MRILHIAPMNIAGVPMTFVRAERSLGHYSRLVTLFPSSQQREEDICLDLPFMDSSLTRFIKRVVVPAKRRIIDNRGASPEEIPVMWQPNGSLEMSLFTMRERIWERRIEDAVKRYRLFHFDLYQLDGGLGFYRDGRFIEQLKKMGKQIICCYTGSDLRVRGVIPSIDRLSDLNVTVEFDHLRLHPDIYHVPFPLDMSAIPPKKKGSSTPLRIGHAPTNRKAKGSDFIISVIKKLESELGIEGVIIENLPYRDALQLKLTCDIFVDQLSDLGYGMNGIEALAMGIPTCSSLAPGFSDLYPDHPFFEVNRANLEDILRRLIKDSGLRERFSEIGRRWVRRVHQATRVVKEIHRLAARDFMKNSGSDSQEKSI